MSAPMTRSFPLPPLGQNPSSAAQGTTPGSFAARPALAPGVAGAKTFASPDTPGMPPPSGKTAWDFLPDGWVAHELDKGVQTPEPGAPPRIEPNKYEPGQS